MDTSRIGRPIRSFLCHNGGLGSHCPLMGPKPVSSFYHRGCWWARWLGSKLGIVGLCPGKAC
eukprot:6212669-Pleurochrysis_carterae.AAC.1